MIILPRQSFFLYFSAFLTNADFKIIPCTPSNEYMVFFTKVNLCAGVGYIQSTVVSKGASARKEDTLIHHFQCGPQPPGGIQLVVKPDRFYTAEFRGEASGDWW